MRPWTNKWTNHKTAQLLALVKKGKTYPEIADVLGTTADRVSSKMLRIRREQEHGPEKTFNELWYDRAKAMGLPTTGIMI